MKPESHSAPEAVFVHDVLLRCLHRQYMSRVLQPPLATHAFAARVRKHTRKRPPDDRRRRLCPVVRSLRHPSPHFVTLSRGCLCKKAEGFYLLCPAGPSRLEQILALPSGRPSLRWSGTERTSRFLTVACPLLVNLQLETCCVLWTFVCSKLL